MIQKSLYVQNNWATAARQQLWMTRKVFWSIKAEFFFFNGKIRPTNAQMPAYASTLWCTSSYLLSSEQLAGNISPTSGAKHLSLGGGGGRGVAVGGAGTEHLCSSMLIWPGSVVRVHQRGSEARLLYLHAATPLVLLINLQMWHLSPNCGSLN